MNKLAVFDLEIARPLSGGDDWLAQKPGISCAAVVLSDTDEVLVWHGIPEMGRHGGDTFVANLFRLRTGGYTLAGFNSAGFDFPMLATESDAPPEVCKGLALNHYDLFFQIFCTLGYSPGLDRIAKGLGLPGKPAGMDGSQAPELWQTCRYQTVLDYLVQDVRTTLDVFRKIEELGCIQWTAKSGKPNTLDIPGFLTVSEAMQLPEPDTSWMTNAWKREKFVGWLDATAGLVLRPLQPGAGCAVEELVMTPQSQAILDRLRTVKPFVLGVSTAAKLAGYGFSEGDRAMQEAFVELVAAGQVVEVQQTAQVSRYGLVGD